MQIKIEANGSTVVFQLNDSQAARALYEQLPLSAEVENFSNNEKIFYPPDRLDTSDAPLAQGGAGTLAYYAPVSYTHLDVYKRQRFRRGQRWLSKAASH